MEESQAFEVPQGQEIKIFRDLVVSIANRRQVSTIELLNARLSCTTNGIYVVQDNRALNRLDRLKPLSKLEIRPFQTNRSWLLFVSQDREFPVLRQRESIAYGGGDSAIGFIEVELSCTTNGIYVVQDNHALNRLGRLKPIFVEKIDFHQADRSWLLFGSQDWKFPVLRWGELIAYRGENSAISFIKLELSCTTNRIYVAQDQGGYDAS